MGQGFCTFPHICVIGNSAQECILFEIILISCLRCFDFHIFSFIDFAAIRKLLSFIVDYISLNVFSICSMVLYILYCLLCMNFCLFVCLYSWEDASILFGYYYVLLVVGLRIGRRVVVVVKYDEGASVKILRS